MLEVRLGNDRGDRSGSIPISLLIGKIRVVDPDILDFLPEESRLEGVSSLAPAGRFFGLPKTPPFGSCRGSEDDSGRFTFIAVPGSVGCF